MTNGFRAALALGLALANTMSPVIAGACQRGREAGVRVTQLGKPDRYCVRVITQREAERLGQPLHTTRCLSERQWARIGVGFAREQARGTSPENPR